jgi:hypothetical protein
MSAQDPRPARPRKLVLRKIADTGGARTPAEVPPSSYTGRRPTRAPASQAPETVKSRQPLILPLASEPVLEPEEIEPDALEAVDEAPSHAAAPPGQWAVLPGDDWRTEEEAGAAAAMTPPAPREAAIPPRSNASIPSSTSGIRAWPTTPRPAVAPVATAPVPQEPSPRPSVAPVVATLPPIGTAPQLPPRRSAMSADSKLLAAGGALAAAMLLVAVGVLLGQRSAQPAPSAAGTGSYPLVIDTKAPAAAALPPPAGRPVEARPAVAETPVRRVDAPTTIDVQNLPLPARPHAQGWSVATPAAKPVASGAGWSVAAAPVVRPAGATTAGATTGAAQPQALTTGDTALAASAAPATPEAPAASAPAPVDPFVQAVRDDIREDETRTK